MYGHTTVPSAVPTALYLAASAAALHDLVEAARSFGDVSVAETAGGYRLSAAGLTLDLELVTDAAIALARVRERYYSLTLIDTRPIGASRDQGELLVGAFLDGQRAERDRELHYHRDRVIALVGGDDADADRLLFAIGQRRIGGFVRERAGAERRAFFGDVWKRIRDASTPRIGKSALLAAGGGITGVYYELGVLKCLDDAFGNFSIHDFDMFFGISAGAIVTSLIANDMPIDEITRRFDPANARSGGFDVEFHLRHLTLLDTPRRMLAAAEHLRSYAARVAAGQEKLSITSALGQLGALVGPFFRTGDKEHQLAAVLAEPGRSNDFRTLRKRLYIGATDQDQREHVLFGAEPYAHVPISRAVQASAAIHPFLAPVEVEGRRYTDGFVTRTTNIAAAIERGADMLFIIDPFLPLISDDPGFNDRHSVFWVLTQDYKTIAYSRYERVSNSLLDLNPHVACYSFLPSNRMRRLLASSPISTGYYDAIVTQAYASTYRRLRRIEFKLGPQLAARGITLDLGPVERRTRLIDGSPRPVARDLWA
jgi:NTE family protein